MDGAPRRALMVAGIVGIAGLAGVSLAGPLSSSGAVQKAIAAAKAALKKGDAGATVGALETALAAARVDAPLELRKVVPVRRPQQGLGVYEPLPEGNKLEFRTLWLYVEVANFGHRALSDGREEVKLSVEGEFFDGEGASIGSRSLGTHRFETRTRAGVRSFGLDVRLGDGAPAGPYGIELQVTDEITGKRAKKKTKFVIP